MAEISSEIEATRRERERLAAEPMEDDAVDPEDALTWLASLGHLWRDTTDEGRRRLALATFERISVVSGPTRASHRIVSIELTVEAERRGRLDATDTERARRLLVDIDVEIVPVELSTAMTAVIGTARSLGLSVYDATYLDLARFREIPIATLDDDLSRACQASGVLLVS